MVGTPAGYQGTFTCCPIAANSMGRSTINARINKLSVTLSRSTIRRPSRSRSANQRRRDARRHDPAHRPGGRPLTELVERHRLASGLRVSTGAERPHQHRSRSLVLL
jgi:hypothetical protein